MNFYANNTYLNRLLLSLPSYMNDIRSLCYFKRFYSMFTQTNSLQGTESLLQINKSYEEAINTLNKFQSNRNVLNDIALSKTIKERAADKLDRLKKYMFRFLSQTLLLSPLSSFRNHGMQESMKRLSRKIFGTLFVHTTLTT
ncbi:hypothetical protein HHI36_013187 [Cryptolaemus montrouzieri]|uniref:Uncharacterized protein n=1 Tax=Cryptolaemus montrouzieri TaxID=559131 RepID=A0ABD2NGK8_9CUCU